MVRQIKSVESVLQQMRDQYVSALPSKFDHIEDLILRLEKDPSANVDKEELLREVHSVKGSAGTYGMPILSSICHQLEDLLHEQITKEWSKDLVNLMLRYLDLLRHTTSQLEQGSLNEAHVSDELRELLNATKTSGPHCLIINNSPANAALIENTCVDSGASCAVETNAFNALQRLLHEPFDCIISTQELAGINGSALIAAMKLSAQQAPYAILVTSKQHLPDAGAGKPDLVLRRDRQLMTQLKEALRRLK